MSRRLATIFIVFFLALIALPTPLFAIRDAGEGAGTPDERIPEGAGSAQPGGVELPFTPTPPRLQIPIPGLPYPELSKVEIQGERGQRYLLIPWIGQYIAGIYRYAIALVGVFATVMIIYGGMRWLTAAGDASAIGKAKEIITNAVIGLVLLLATTVILYTVNPELTQFKNLRIAFTERLKMPEVVENEGDDQARSLSGVNCPGPSQLASIPASRGLTNTAGKKARPDTVAALIRAGEAAAAEGCEISITESWRSLEQQRIYWEASLANRRRDCGKPNGCASCEESAILACTRQATSYPDPSCTNNVHIMGHAVDVSLVCEQGGRKVTIAGFGGCKGQNNIPVERRKRLQTIMSQGGFVRYCAENWHFEVGTSRWNEGKASNREYAGNCECAGVYHAPY